MQKKIGRFWFYGGRNSGIGLGFNVISTTSHWIYYSGMRGLSSNGTEDNPNDR